MFKQGKFIALYGTNNIGKSTQIDLLRQRINRELACDVKIIKYPIYDLEPSGPMLNDYLRHGGKKWSVTKEMAQSLYTFNRLQYEPILKSHLNEGTHVVAEDYVGTGIAWGVAYGQDRKHLEYLNSALLSADLSILLDGQRYIKAAEKKHCHEQDESLINKVRQELSWLAFEHNWPVVEANKSIEEVHQQIWRIVKAALTK